MRQGARAVCEGRSAGSVGSDRVRVAHGDTSCRPEYQHQKDNIAHSAGPLGNLGHARLPVREVPARRGRLGPLWSHCPLWALEIPSQSLWTSQASSQELQTPSAPLHIPTPHSSVPPGLVLADLPRAGPGGPAGASCWVFHNERASWIDTRGRQITSCVTGEKAQILTQGEDTPEAAFAANPSLNEE